jgi:hypothetical protein
MAKVVLYWYDMAEALRPLVNSFSLHLSLLPPIFSLYSSNIKFLLASCVKHGGHLLLTPKRVLRNKSSNRHTY